MFKPCLTYKNPGQRLPVAKPASTKEQMGKLRSREEK